jgi:hypothetical protein
LINFKGVEKCKKNNPFPLMSKGERKSSEKKEKRVFIYKGRVKHVSNGEKIM